MGFRVLSPFQLPLSGSPHLETLRRNKEEKTLTFNSLSRDHLTESCTKASISIVFPFQLPLSGSHDCCSEEECFAENYRLSTPSLGITRPGGQRAQHADRRFQLPLSGSLGQFVDLAEKLYDPFNSLSRDHIDGKDKAVLAVLDAFNSLSRDHLPAGACSARFLCLSTPSLGIT